MIEYILAFMALITAYDHIHFFLIKRSIKGYVRIKKGCEPIFLQGKKKQGVILLHGFSSSPGEVRELAKHLHKKGLTVYAPLLPGHGTTPAMLAMTTWQQWVAAGEEAIDMIAPLCKEIWLVGNSMGGNLALINAKRHKQVKGVVVISTPIFYGKKNNIARLIFPILRRIKFFQKKKYNKEFKKIFNKDKREEAYNVIPLRSLKQLVKTVKLSRKSIASITQPILVCQANPDEVMDVSSGNFIINKVQSERRELMYVKNSLHLVLIDPRYKQKIYKRIFQFIHNGK